MKVLAFVLTLLSGELHNTGISVSNSSSSSTTGSVNKDCDLEKEEELNPCENTEPLRIYISVMYFRIDISLLICALTRGILASCSGTQQSFKRMAQDQPEGSSLGKKSRGPPPTRIDVSTDLTNKKYKILFFFLYSLIFH